MAGAVLARADSFSCDDDKAGPAPALSQMRPLAPAPLRQARDRLAPEAEGAHAPGFAGTGFAGAE